MDASAAHERAYLPLHRSEALTDRIYAVAMTLLVIELKVPEAGHIRGYAELADALVALLPKAFAWVISFAHHRVFSCAGARRLEAGLAQHAPARVLEPDAVLVRLDRREGRGALRTRST